MSQGPDAWLEFQSRFRELAEEEARVPQREPLGVHAELREHPEIYEQCKEGVSWYSLLKAPRHGLWEYRCRTNPDLEARFRALAARAGVALGNPEGTNPEDFWLNRLFFDLLRNDRRALFSGTENGGMILSVCRSSASFCARLERDAIEQADRSVVSHAQNSGKTAQNVENNAANTRADVKMRIGQNIEKLRKECGWSLDKLADKTGIDKKAILSHVHGKSKPNPNTQKEYAQAFAKELNRQITANNLEE